MLTNLTQKACKPILGPGEPGHDLGRSNRSGLHGSPTGVSSLS